MPRYAAVLDACVLVPVVLADTLLRVAEKGLYRPLWSQRILTEAREAIEEIHPGTDVSKRFAGMNAAFDDALVTGGRSWNPGSSCPTTMTGMLSRSHPGRVAACVTSSGAALLRQGGGACRRRGCHEGRSCRPEDASCRAPLRGGRSRRAGQQRLHPARMAVV
jgi:hypothetical protein